jgi:hypothetical protein
VAGRSTESLAIIRMREDIITRIGLIAFAALLFQIGRHFKNQSERILEQSVSSVEHREALAVGPRYGVAFLNVGALAFAVIGVSTVIAAVWNHWA